MQKIYKSAILYTQEVEVHTNEFYEEVEEIVKKRLKEGNLNWYYFWRLGFKEDAYKIYEDAKRDVINELKNIHKKIKKTKIVLNNGQILELEEKDFIII